MRESCQAPNLDRYWVTLERSVNLPQSLFLHSKKLLISLGNFGGIMRNLYAGLLKSIEYYKKYKAITEKLNLKGCFVWPIYLCKIFLHLSYLEVWMAHSFLRVLGANQPEVQGYKFHGYFQGICQILSFFFLRKGNLLLLTRTPLRL